VRNAAMRWLMFLLCVLSQFNVAAFSELELHLPTEPVSATSGVPVHVASFELEGVSYRLIEGSAAETSDLINLFPSPTKAGELELGKPFTRCFRICRDVTFPAPPKPIPVNPLGRAPRQLAAMKKNFFPVGYISEALKKEWKSDERQGKILRSTSARPASPRVLPLHGFDLAEWRPALAAKQEPKSSAAAGGSKAKKSSATPMDVDDGDAAEAARKKAKKEAKKRAAEQGDVEGQSAAKKHKSSSAAAAAGEEEGAKSKKEKKAKKEKQ
jgi:hypothetical protein